MQQEIKFFVRNDNHESPLLFDAEKFGLKSIPANITSA
jgi:hypothetical protein